MKRTGTPGGDRTCQCRASDRGGDFSARGYRAALRVKEIDIEVKSGGAASSTLIVLIVPLSDLESCVLLLKRVIDPAIYGLADTRAHAFHSRLRQV